MNGSKKESNRRNSKGPGGAACINARRQNYPTCPPGFPDPATIVPKREKRRPQPPQPARHTKLRCPSYRTGHQRPQLTLGTSRRCCLLAAATLAGWPFGRLGGPRSRRRSSLAPTCGAGGAGCVPAGRQAGLVCTYYPRESASTPWPTVERAQAGRAAVWSSSATTTEPIEAVRTQGREAGDARLPTEPQPPPHLLANHSAEDGEHYCPARHGHGLAQGHHQRDAGVHRLQGRKGPPPLRGGCLRPHRAGFPPESQDGMVRLPGRPAVCVLAVWTAATHWRQQLTQLATPILPPPFFSQRQSRDPQDGPHMRPCFRATAPAAA